MARHARLLIFLVLLLMTIPGQLRAELRLQTVDGRWAFYRGEEIRLLVHCVNDGQADLPAGQLAAFLGDMEVSRAAVPGLRSGQRGEILLRIDSEQARSAPYELAVRWSLGEDAKSFANASHPLTIAHRPDSGRMTVWLWPHQAFVNTVEKFNEQSRKAVDWWAGMGLNNFAFTLGAVYGPDARQFWDYALAKGWTVCLQPEGGLTDVKIESADPDVYFRDPSGKYHDKADNPSGVAIANPFHPLVQQWQDRKNQAMMEVAGRYPQVTTAFFNTEVIDELARNANPAGNQLIQRELGFDESAMGKPKFVQPGVIADDDPRYLYNKFVYKKGNGLTTANQRTSAMIWRYRPDILTISDPYRSYALLDGFAGLDVLGSWTYTNPDPKYMLYVEMLRAAARDGGKIPLSTVTLLNYPGELAPTKRWMMMDAGRLTVATWINLSRAPRMLGYYFSSQCDPFGALKDDLKTLDAEVGEFEMPRETFDKLAELSAKVIEPYGPLIKQLNLSPRKIAVLGSQAAREYGTSPAYRQHYANTQAFEFYILLAMAQLPADVVLDESIERFGLDQYDVLVLPKCDVLTESVYKAVQAFLQRGGMVIADQYLGPQLAGSVIRFDFDFTYRGKVSAMAIAENKAYAQWNDHLKPGSAQTSQVKGVTALDDQHIMESYARQLRETLGDRISRRVDCDLPTALLNLTEADGISYLFVINDKREYGPRLGQYKSVLEKLVPQAVRIELNDPALAACAPYDLLRRQRLEVQDGAISVNLDQLGGTIIAFYPQALQKLELGVSDTFRGDDPVTLKVDLADAGGHAMAGVFPLKLTLTDPQGRPADVTGYYSALRGALRIPFRPARNDLPGQWKLRVEDLAAGLSAEALFTVRDGEQSK